jgi:sugar-specific transcriptional regulator TrmB
MLKELTSLGLREKHAKIYAVALQLGGATVAQLAEKSGIKRPTVYLQLEEMVAEGLMQKIKLNKKTLYQPQNPALFDKQLLEKQGTVAKLKEEYAATKNTSGMPHVSVYEGFDSMKHLYNEIANANFIRFWCNLDEVYQHAPKQAYMISDTIRANGTNTREIVSNTKESKRAARHFRQLAGPTYSVRAASIDGLQNDSAVTDTALYIFRLHEFNFFAIKIEDPTIASSYRTLFEMAWKSAETF